jgi:demethylmenaquinone methyltransferase/2-methoxy-6-polyprenyl-1,4-benzoquinol methylase/phosphoethanolamine N-methyltransferase
LYGFIVWVITRGKELAFRKFIAELTELKQGESVLDVGCGTGTMTLLAKQYVGEAGKSCGIEPSLEMVAFARQKAKRQNILVDIHPGVIERINYPPQSFDAILCLIVMHHMPDETKIQGIKEIARVLKPGGRLVVVDSNLHLLPSFEKEGFVQVKTGKVPSIPDYDFVLWKKGNI